MNPPIIRTDIVKSVLGGCGNKHKSENVSVRYPCTINLIKLLKAELKGSNIESSQKLVIFSAATIAFFGGLRMNELLSKGHIAYDPKYTLLRSDITIHKTMLDGKSVEVLSLDIKHSKTGKKSEIVDIYSNNESICPVKVAKKLLKSTRELPKDYPFMSDKKGKLLTLKDFNSHLHKLLDSKLKGCKGRVSGHSFRAGLTSLFGSLGYSEQELKAFGRWSSRAFSLYIKNGRTNRREIAKQASQLTTI